MPEVHLYRHSAAAEAAACLTELFADLNDESGRTSGEQLDTWHHYYAQVLAALEHYDELIGNHRRLSEGLDALVANQSPLLDEVA